MAVIISLDNVGYKNYIYSEIEHINCVMGDYFTRGCLLDCAVISIAAISVTLSDHVRQNYSFLLFFYINICGVMISRRQQHYHYFPSDEPFFCAQIT